MASLNLGEKDESGYQKLSWGTHSRQIVNENHVAEKHICDDCKKMFKSIKDLHQHQDGHCRNGEPKYVYPGGTYQLKETVFQELKTWGIIVDVDRQLCTAFATWDCEALLERTQTNFMLKEIDEKMEQRLNDQNLEVEYADDAKQLQFLERHVLVSCALKSTVPGGEETRFFCDKDPEKVVEDAYNAMIELSDLNYDQQRKKFAKEFERLDELVKMAEERITEYKQEGRDVRRVKAGLVKLQRLIQRLDNYCRQLTILTFNGGRYDLNLVKKHLFPKMVKEVRRAKTEDPKGYHPWPRAITRGSTIMCLTTENLRFLDVMLYLGPGISLGKFIKAFNPNGEQKGTFPYEMVRKFEDLEATTEFPPKSAFYSTLKNRNITDTEYEDARRIWDGLETKTLLEFIKHYNTNDVEPFLEACTNMVNLYWEQCDVDIFKEAISLPGVSMIFLFRRTQKLHPEVRFGLFSEAEASLCQELYGKKSLCGGLSFIGQRIAIAGVTPIKRAKLV